MEPLLLFNVMQFESLNMTVVIMQVCTFLAVSQGRAGDSVIWRTLPTAVDCFLTLLIYFLFFKHSPMFFKRESSRRVNQAGYIIPLLFSSVNENFFFILMYIVFNNHFHACQLDDVNFYLVRLCCVMVWRAAHIFQVCCMRE